MTHYEVYALILCVVVFVLLVSILVSFLTVVVRQTLKLIRHGIEDEKIAIEYHKNKDRKESIFDKITRIISILFCCFLFVTYGLALYSQFSEDSKVGNVPSLRVVTSQSMSKKHENNVNLFTNNINDHLQMYDVVVIHKLPGEFELELYDIVVYKVDDIYVIHRIVGIEEPNEKHPDHRYFALQGDAVENRDRFPVMYDQMVGIYEGNRIPFIGSFVMFLQSYAGFLCVVLIIFAMIAIPIVEKIIEREKLLRLRLLNIIEDEDYENSFDKKLFFNSSGNKTFIERLLASEDNVKRLYNEAKNYLLNYNCESKIFKRCESFRNKGLIARFTLPGKYLKIYLAIDPKTLDNSVYSFKDLSKINKQSKVPTMIKLRTNKNLKHFKEIVDIIMQGRNIIKDDNYQYRDYINLMETIDVESKVAEKDFAQREENLKAKELLLKAVDGKSAIYLKLRKVKKFDKKLLKNNNVLEKVIENYDVKESFLSKLNGKSAIYLKLKKIKKCKKK